MDFEKMYLSKCKELEKLKLAYEELESKSYSGKSDDIEMLLQEEIEELNVEISVLKEKNQLLTEQVNKDKQHIAKINSQMDNLRDNHRHCQIDFEGRLGNLQRRVNELENENDTFQNKIRANKDDIHCLSNDYNKALEDLAFAYNELEMLKESQAVEEQPPPDMNFEQSAAVEMIDSLISNLSDCLQTYTSNYKDKITSW